MGWLQHRKPQKVEIDEHDVPTEPVPAAHPSAFAPTIAAQGPHIDAFTTRKLPEYPQPQQQILLPAVPDPLPGATTARAENMLSAGITSPNPVGAMQQPWSAPLWPTPSAAAPVPSWGNAQAGAGASVPGVPIYPVLPPAPVFKESGRPPGNARRAISTDASQGKAQRQLGRRCALALLGWLFVATQFLLLVRFFLLYITLPWPGASAEVGIIVALSNACMLPFQLLIQRVSLQTTIDPALYLLAAILMYGLLGRIVMPILRRVLRMRR